MKKHFLFVIIALVTLPVLSQNASGTIYYEKGNTLKFHKVETFTLFIKEYGGTNYSSLKARYQGTVRDIPFNKLVEFRIHQFSVSQGQARDVIAEITTKTGVNFKTEYLTLNNIRVEILDELTGEKTKQDVRFTELGKLNIRRIVFD